MSIESGHVETNVPKVDEWRDGMVEQVSEYMDIIKDMDAEKAIGADTVLAEAFESIQDNSTDAVMGLMDVYSRSDTSGRSAIARCSMHSRAQRSTTSSCRHQMHASRRFANSARNRSMNSWSRRLRTIALAGLRLTTSMR